MMGKREIHRFFRRAYLIKSGAGWSVMFPALMTSREFSSFEKAAAYAKKFWDDAGT